MKRRSRVKLLRAEARALTIDRRGGVKRPLRDKGDVGCRSEGK